MAAGSSTENTMKMDESYNMENNTAKKVYEALLSGKDEAVATLKECLGTETYEGQDFFKKVCRKVGTTDVDLKRIDADNLVGEQRLREACDEYDKQVKKKVGGKKKSPRKAKAPLTYPKDALNTESTFPRVEKSGVENLVYKNKQGTGFMDFMTAYREAHRMEGRSSIREYVKANPSTLKQDKFKKGVSASLQNLACMLWGLQNKNMVIMTDPKVLEFYNMENNKYLLSYTTVNNKSFHSLEEEELENAIDIMSCDVDVGRLCFTWVFNTLSKYISENVHKEEKQRHECCSMEFDPKGDTVNNAGLVVGAAYVETMARSIARLVNKDKITDDLNELLHQVNPLIAKSSVRNMEWNEVFSEKKFLEGYSYDDFCTMALLDMNKFNREARDSELELKKELHYALRKIYHGFISNIRRLKGNFTVDLHDRLASTKSNPEDVNTLKLVFDSLMAIWQYTFKHTDLFTDHEASEKVHFPVSKSDLHGAFHFQILRSGLKTFQRMRSKSMDWSIEMLMQSLAGTSYYDDCPYAMDGVRSTTKFYFYKNLMQLALEPVGVSAACLKKMDARAKCLTSERLKAKEVAKKITRQNKKVKTSIKHLCKWIDGFKSTVVVKDEEVECTLSSEEILLTGYFKPLNCVKTDSVDFTFCLPLLRAVKNIVGVFGCVLEDEKYRDMVLEDLKKQNLSEDLLRPPKQEPVEERPESPQSTTTESTEEGSPVPVTGKRKKKGQTGKSSKRRKIAVRSHVRRSKVAVPKYLGFEHANNIEEICNYLDAYKILFRVGAQYLSDNMNELLSNKPILFWHNYLGSVWNTLESTFDFNWPHQESYDKGIYKSRGYKAKFDRFAISRNPTLLIDAMKKAYLKVEKFQEKSKLTTKKYLPTPCVIHLRSKSQLLPPLSKLKEEDYHTLVRDFGEEHDGEETDALSSESEEESPTETQPMELEAL